MSAPRLADLKAKLASRQDRPGFTRNAQRIRAEIARLEAQQTQSATAEQEAAHGQA